MDTPPIRRRASGYPDAGPAEPQSPRPNPNPIGEPTFQEVHVTVDAASFAKGHAVAHADDDTGPNEIWTLVVEKAYAKLCGGYNAIGHGGSTRDALEVLTGQPAHDMTLGIFHRYGANDLRNDLAAGRVVLLGTGRGVPEYGLVDHHCYVVTGLTLENDRWMVQLANPWGHANPSPVPVDELARTFRVVHVGSVTGNP